MTFTDGIIQTFGKFLLSEPQLLEAIRLHSFTASATSWHFTLPSLHAFMKTREGSFSDIKYKKFIQKLFQSPINQQLKTLNGKIIIIDNRHNVDLTTYALSRIEKN